MNTLLKALLVASLTVMLTACGGPTLDASSEEAMKQSAIEMTKDMTAAEKMEFQMAIASVAMEVAFKNMGDEEKMEEAMMDALDGKTVEEILEMSKGK